MKVLFENDFFKVEDTNQDYDFMAIIENKKDKDIIIDVGDECESYALKIKGKDYLGLLNNDFDREILNAIMCNNFYVKETK